MNSTPDDPQPGFLLALARVLGQSRSGQLVAAVLVASVSGGMAYLLWQIRAFAGLVLTVGILSYGIRTAWEFLPIPVGLRQALARRKEFYNLIAVGCFLLVAPFLPGSGWPGWHYLGFTLLGAAFASITPFLARLYELDRSKKSGHL